MSLEDQWRAHLLSRPTAVYVALVRRGAPRQAIVAGLATIADILVQGDHFDFAQEAEKITRALVVAVRQGPDATWDGWIAEDPYRTTLGGELVDLVAETMNGRCFSYLDHAQVLGVVEPQILSPSPTRVWRSPRSWLRANCEGIVLVDPRPMVRQRVLLSLVGPILAEDAAHAAELRAILAAPPLNLRRVIVAGASERRAA